MTKGGGGIRNVNIKYCKGLKHKKEKGKRQESPPPRSPQKKRVAADSETIYINYSNYWRRSNQNTAHNCVNALWILSPLFFQLFLRFRSTLILSPSLYISGKIFDYPCFLKERHRQNQKNKRKIITIWGFDFFSNQFHFFFPINRIRYFPCICLIAE